jgi:hypothetical protein
MNREIPSQTTHAIGQDGAVTPTDILILGVAALILALPMLIYGPMVKGHDTREHFNYCLHFGKQFWGGEWYPRWLLDINHGLGSPSLFVYPPFGSYVYALLLPVGGEYFISTRSMLENLWLCLPLEYARSYGSVLARAAQWRSRVVFCTC